MKLLVRADDFGFTRGMTYAIMDCIERGTLTATGLFTNMGEFSEFAAQQMKNYPHICFGIDFNIVSGPCVADPKLIPHLVDGDGNFIRSSVKYKDPLFKTEEGRDILWPKEEVAIELHAQYQRYLDLVGKKPEYVHTHSIGRTVPSYYNAVRDLGHEMGITYTHEIQEQFHFGELQQDMAKSSFWNKEFDAQRQMEADPLARLFSQSEYMLSFDYAVIGAHPGYVDAELMRLTSLSLQRAKEAEYFLSPRLREWIRSNNVELISYRDLIKD